MDDCRVIKDRMAARGLAAACAVRRNSPDFALKTGAKQEESDQSTAPLSMPTEIPYNSALSVFRNCCEAFHESAVVPQVRKEASPRLQGRASPRQGIRDLQEQPALQGAPALSGTPLPDFEKRTALRSFFLMVMDGLNAGPFGVPDAEGHSPHPCRSEMPEHFPVP
jgi:hypothetical protein